MKVYDLKGFVVDGTTAVVVISLPKETEDNKYCIEVKGKFADSGVNKLFIVMTDLKDSNLSVENNTNFYSLIIDLQAVGFNEVEIQKSIKVVFKHLKSKTKDWVTDVIAQGKGIIKP